MTTLATPRQNRGPVIFLAVVLLVGSLVATILVTQEFGIKVPSAPREVTTPTISLAIRAPGELVRLEESYWEHARVGHSKTVPCVLALANGMEPDEVWRSHGTPKEPYISVVYAWNAGSKKNLGLTACLGLPAAIAFEYAGVPGANDPTLFKVVLIIGERNETIFPVNIYPVLARPHALWELWRRDHGYTECLYKCFIQKTAIKHTH